MADTKSIDNKKEEINLSMIRSKEIKKFEKAMRGFATRTITKKTEDMRYEFGKDIKRIPLLENEYIELAIRVSKLERLMEKK